MGNESKQVQAETITSSGDVVKRRRSVKQRIRVKKKKSTVKRHRYILAGLFLILSLLVAGYYLDSMYKSKKEKTLKEKTLETNEELYSQDLIKDFTNSMSLEQ